VAFAGGGVAWAGAGDGVELTTGAGLKVWTGAGAGLGVLRVLPPVVDPVDVDRCCWTAAGAGSGFGRLVGAVRSAPGVCAAAGAAASSRAKALTSDGAMQRYDGNWGTKCTDRLDP
jgi:hypothetical protein